MLIEAAASLALSNFHRSVFSLQFLYAWVTKHTVEYYRGVYLLGLYCLGVVNRKTYGHILICIKIILIDYHYRCAYMTTTILGHM